MKRRIPGLHQETVLQSLEIKDTWEPLEVCQYLPPFSTPLSEIAAGLLPDRTHRTTLLWDSAHQMGPSGCHHPNHHAYVAHNCGFAGFAPVICTECSLHDATSVMAARRV